MKLSYKTTVDTFDALHIYAFKVNGCPNSRVDSVAAKNLPRRSHS
jgi:hypothetical protein